MDFKRRIAKEAVPPILDWGGGIGDQVLRCWMEGKNCDYLDIKGGNTWDFANFRFNKYNIKLNIYDGSDYISTLPFDTIYCKYNTIILLDVIEHVNHPAELLNYITSIMPINGILYITYPFGKTEQHPLHFDAPLGWNMDNELKKRGYRKESDNKYVLDIKMVKMSPRPWG